MKELNKVEKSLEKLFKGLPNISEAGRESVAKVLPIIALVAGVFQLLAAWWVYRLATVVEQVDQFVRSFSTLAGTSYAGLSSADKLLIYVGAVVLLVDAVILLMAYKPLSERKKRGWDLLFLGGLLNVAYSVVSLFISGRGFGSFLFGLIVSGACFWLLFQVKGRYGAAKKASSEKKPTTQSKKK